MKVWKVGVNDCESNSTVCICSTKEIAIREMFKVRDGLIAQDEMLQDYYLKNGLKNMKKVSDSLGGLDYNAWNNFPHETPYIHEMEIIDK